MHTLDGLFICFPAETNLESTIPGMPGMGIVGRGLISLAGAIGSCDAIETGGPDMALAMLLFSAIEAD